MTIGIGRLMLPSIFKGLEINIWPIHVNLLNRNQNSCMVLEAASVFQSASSVRWELVWMKLVSSGDTEEIEVTEVVVMSTTIVTAVATSRQIRRTLRSMYTTKADDESSKSGLQLNDVDKNGKEDMHE
ncbi:hypothetical protein VNO77_05326 [Canavalia gladiata]|uniref:Uncharacterized protein n=1 Tax=Canavalia gladiata TaxID=3824 RepID=A0AAN9MY69_CANGL